MNTFQHVAESYNPTTFSVAHGYPKRFEVSDVDVSWDVPVQGYRPSRYTADEILNAPYGDRREQANIEKIGARLLENDVVRFSVDGQPLNPHGRTGIEGRGSLGCYGPNYLGVFALIAANATVLVIERSDNGAIALPAGYREGSESMLQAATREAREEVIPDYDFSAARRVGDLFMIPDPKTTDNAWLMAGVAADTIEDSSMVVLQPLKAEVRHAMWLPITEAQDRLFPAHAHALDFVLRSLV